MRRYEKSRLYFPELGHQGLVSPLSHGPVCAEDVSVEFMRPGMQSVLICFACIRNVLLQHTCVPLELQYEQIRLTAAGNQFVMADSREEQTIDHSAKQDGIQCGLYAKSVNILLLGF